MITDFFKTDGTELGAKPISNYHTHNYLCGHAGGTVSDYAEEAVKNGFTEIGISDHCVSPINSGEYYITAHNLHDEYLPQFDIARDKFGDKISILSAVEIEYFEGYDDYYALLTRNLDYLVLGQHEYMMNGVRRSSYDQTAEADILAYCKNVKAALKTGLFALLAHPDLIFYRRPTVTKKAADAFDSMIQEAADLGIAVELNANGIRYHGFSYPTDILISSCLKHNATVVVSSDCHSPEQLCDSFMLKLYRYAKSRGLNVTDKLNIKKR